MKIKFFIISVFLSFLFFAPAFAKDKQKAYLIPIQFDKGQAAISEDITVSEVFVPEEEIESLMSFYRFRLELFSSLGKKLEERKFSVHNEIFREPPKEGEESEEVGSIVQDQLEQTEIIPFHEDGVLLRLFNANNKLVDQKDISYLVKKEKDIVKEGQTKESNVQTGNKVVEKQTDSLVKQYIIYFSVFILIVFLIIIFFVINHKKE